MDLTDGIERNRGSHVTNLFDVKGGKLLKIMSAIAARMSPDIGDAICDEKLGPKVVEVMIEAARQYLENCNPYKMTVEQQLAALRLANQEEGWGIPEEVFAQLAVCAPEWPRGQHSYRSLCIRFGGGSEGVALTFERHVARIDRVLGGEKGFSRWPNLYSGIVSFGGRPVERLRLLVGNHTHFEGIDWVTVDLDTHRQRKSMESVRGPHSAADELLVIMWMFPDMLRALEHDKLPNFFVGGYEINIPEYGHGTWRDIMLVYRDPATLLVHLTANSKLKDDPRISVPVRRKKNGH